MNAEMSQALGTVVSALEKNFGKGVVMQLNEEVPYDPEDVLSSGSIGIDTALGIGGYKKGRIVEIYGPESSGKSTLCLHAVAEAQKTGGKCLYIDAEHALDTTYASRLGVDIPELLISQPDYGEQALEIAAMFAKSGEIRLIIIDSVAALVPKAELEGNVGDHHVGKQARMMSQAMRMLAGAVNQTGCIVMFVNQIRMKIGVMFGSPETTTGGNALKYAASQRIDIRRIGAVKEKDEIIGNRTRVKIIKNKLAPPFKEFEFDIRYGVGIDRYGELLDLGSDDDVVEKSGSWYSYKETRIGQGRNNAIAFLKENPDMAEKIEKEIRELRGLIHQEE